MKMYKATLGWYILLYLYQVLNPVIFLEYKFSISFLDNVDKSLLRIEDLSLLIERTVHKAKIEIYEIIQ